MTLWRGFKEHAVQIAGRVRARLNLSMDDPVDVEALAALYELDIAGISEIGCPSDAVDHLTASSKSRLSGLILPVDGTSLIIYDDSCPLPRIRSTITHEVSHHILQHEHLMRVAFAQGCSNPDRDQEDEAAELGGELMIPRVAARRAAIQRTPSATLAEQYGASIEMAQWRMNMSGGARIRPAYAQTGR